MGRIIARFSKKSQRASETGSEQAHDFQGEVASRRVSPQSTPGRLTVENPNVFYTVEDRQNEIVIREYDAFIGGLSDMVGLEDEFQRNFYDREVIVRKPRTVSERSEYILPEKPSRIITEDFVDSSCSSSWVSSKERTGSFW